MAFNIGYTSVLACDHTSSYVEIANLTEIKLPSIDIKDVPATTLNQATNIEQTIPGMRSNGKLSATVLYVEAGYALLRSYIGVTQNFKVTTPDAHTFVWNGYLQKIGEVTITDEKVLEYPIEITCLSDVTVT